MCIVYEYVRVCEFTVGGSRDGGGVGVYSAGLVDEVV